VCSFARVRASPAPGGTDASDAAVVRRTAGDRGGSRARTADRAVCGSRPGRAPPPAAG
jgi:hypothetical protein